MRLPRYLFLLISLFSVSLPSSPSAAQVLSDELPPPPPVAKGEGALELEILGALVGNLAATVAAGAVVVDKGFCIDGDTCDRDPKLFRRRILGVQGVRMASVGGATYLLGTASGGGGRGYAAMLGALPGALLIGTGFLFPRHEIGPIVIGHLATIIGAVAAYRYSARRQARARHGSAMSHILPGAYADRNGAGLTLSATF